MKYLLVLIIMFNDGDFTLMTNKHPPFDTKEECLAYNEFIKPKTEEMLAKLIDEGHEVIDSGAACKPVPVNEP